MAKPNVLEPISLELAELWSLLDSTTSGVFLWDATVDKVFWSESLHQLLGTSPGDEAELKEVQKLLHPDDIETHKSTVRESMESKNKYSIVARYKHAKGHFITLDIHGIWLTKNNKDILLGYVLDLDERNKIRASIKNSESQLRAFLDNCPAAVYIKDKDSNHIYGNRKAAEFAGVSVEKFQNSSMQEIFPPDTAEQLIKTDKEVFRDNEPKTWSGLVNTEGGDKKFLFDTKFPLRDIESGEPMLGGFGFDLTEQHNAIERANHKQRLESLGLLAGGIAHDFNNQLTIIMQSARNIGIKDLPEVDVDVDKIMYASRISADLCQQLLSYAGEDVGPVKTYDLKEFITSFQNILSVYMSNCRVDYDLEDCSVDISKTHFQQILFNLTMNASQACDDTGVKINLKKVTRKDIPKHNVYHEWFDTNTSNLVLLEVKNNGIPIPHEYIHKIFDPFFTTRVQGNGMGLPAVLGIVRSLKGSIGCTSISSGETCFRVYLPLSESTENEKIHKESHFEVLKIKNKPKALIVDDEKLVADAVGELFSEMGLQCTIVNSGLNAVKKLTELPKEFDLVALDLTMPEMDGIQTLEEIRKINTEIPIILMSGYSSKDLTHVLNDKVQFASKPFDFMEFQKLTEKLIKS